MSWLTKLFEVAKSAIKPKTMYENLYNTAEILATKRDEVSLICKRMTTGEARYEAVAAVLARCAGCHAATRKVATVASSLSSSIV